MQNHIFCSFNLNAKKFEMNDIVNFVWITNVASFINVIILGKELKIRESVVFFVLLWFDSMCRQPLLFWQKLLMRMWWGWVTQYFLCNVPVALGKPGSLCIPPIPKPSQDGSMKLINPSWGQVVIGSLPFIVLLITLLLVAWSKQRKGMDILLVSLMRYLTI
jgi:hypothetical protein